MTLIKATNPSPPPITHRAGLQPFPVQYSVLYMLYADDLPSLPYRLQPHDTQGGSPPLKYVPPNVLYCRDG